MKTLNVKSGYTFGVLMAIRPHEKRHRELYWIFRCFCGKERPFRVRGVLLGNVKSCGCVRHSSKVIDRSRWTSPEKDAWNGIMRRCYKTHHKGFKNYGGRGIKVCDRWRFGENGLSGFKCFLEDMGAKPSKKHSIDRINNDGDYEPSNCRWATIYEQLNNKRNSRFVTILGVSKTISQWAREVGMNSGTLYYRIRKGWDVVLAITQPSRNK